MKRHNSSRQYVICVRNDDAEDLVVGKVYKVLPDENAGEEFLRVIDESGEDYLYPSDHFLPIDLPKPVERALATKEAVA